MQDFIGIRGARVHNLKNISLSIPHNQLTVITGVSGSGKSSLAFDTIYAEGQRRYVESLSAYARQFLERMEKPEVEEIDGIAPAVAIRQKNTTRNPRSTVATSTECHDFCVCCSRASDKRSAPCGTRVERHGGRGGGAAAATAGGSRWYALFPCGSTPAAQALRDHLFDLRKKGFNRLFQDGRVFEFSTPESLLDIDFSTAASSSSRTASPSAPTCTSASSTPSKSAIAKPAKSSSRRRVGRATALQRELQCKTAASEFSEPEPMLFSFNRPAGACPRCQGFGNTIDFDMDLRRSPIRRTVARRRRGGSVDQAARRRIVAGDFKKNGGRQGALQRAVLRPRPKPSRRRLYEFIRRFFDYLETKKYKVHVRVFLSRYRGYARCPDCQGSRLRKEAL